MADLGNQAVISPTDASNGSGTMPSWLGSAAPSTLDDAGRALQGAVAREWENRSYPTATGTAPAFVVTYTVAPAAYRSGQTYTFTAHAAAVGTDTLNANTLGAKGIKKVVAGVKTATAANDFYAGDKIACVYDGTDMVWVQPYPNAARTTDANTFAANQTITSADAGAAAGPIAILYRNSATPAADDVIGQLRFDGEDSAGNQQEYAAIQATISDATTTEEDGSLDIYALIAGTRTRYFTAGRNAAGTLTPNAIGLPLGQLSFPATQNASSDANTLDDYEEGTFTPAFAASGATFSYSSQTGIYVKVGRIVHFGLQVVLNTSGNTLASAALTITGLPFTSNTTGFTSRVFPVDWFASTTSYILMYANLGANSSTLDVRGLTAASTSGPTALNSNAALHATNGSKLFVTGVYMSDT